VTFTGVVRLIEEHAREHGLLDSSGKLKSGIGTGHYLTFNRFIKEALALLGIERRQLEPELTLADVIQEHREKAGENRAALTQDGRSEDQGSSGQGEEP
jgi:hypothetical protein